MDSARKHSKMAGSWSGSGPNRGRSCQLRVPSSGPARLSGRSDPPARPPERRHACSSPPTGTSAN